MADRPIKLTRQELRRAINAERFSGLSQQEIDAFWARKSGMEAMGSTLVQRGLETGIPTPPEFTPGKIEAK